MKVLQGVCHVLSICVCSASNVLFRAVPFEFPESLQLVQPLPGS